MFCSQLDPEKVIGKTKKTDPDGTTIVDASTLQAAAHAASNACLALKEISIHLPQLNEQCKIYVEGHQ